MHKHHNREIKILALGKLGYTPAEPAVSPQKPINRLLKTDCHCGTT